LLKQLTRRPVERALEAEMTAHLGYAPYAPEGRGSGNFTVPSNPTMRSPALNPSVPSERRPAG
jgi:transposase-like protein